MNERNASPTQEVASPRISSIITTATATGLTNHRSNRLANPPMPDTYCNFDELVAHQRRNVDYRIHASIRPSPVAIIAPHGGGIEPGTSELAQAIAGDNFSYYCFESVRLAENKQLHIASHRFDEPGLAHDRSTRRGRRGPARVLPARGMRVDWGA